MTVLTGTEGLRSTAGRWPSWTLLRMPRPRSCASSASAVLQASPTTTVAAIARPSMGTYFAALSLIGEQMMLTRSTYSPEPPLSPVMT